MGCRWRVFAREKNDRDTIRFDMDQLTKLAKRLDCFNTLVPKRNGWQFAEDMFKCIFTTENGRILIPMSLMFVPNGPIGNKLSLNQVMAWCLFGAKPLAELMITQVTDAYMRHLASGSSGAGVAPIRGVRTIRWWSGYTNDYALIDECTCRDHP